MLEIPKPLHTRNGFAFKRVIRVEPPATVRKHASVYNRSLLLLCLPIGGGSFLPSHRTQPCKMPKFDPLCASLIALLAPLRFRLRFRSYSRSGEKILREGKAELQVFERAPAEAKL